MYHFLYNETKLFFITIVISNISHFIIVSTCFIRYDMISIYHNKLFEFIKYFFYFSGLYILFYLHSNAFAID